jgi:hypothetical protein
MFNPNNSTNFKSFWNRLSTFYDFVPSNEKEIIEAYWRQLFNSTEGLYYDLAQAMIAGYIDYAPGYIEDQYIDYNIVFDGDYQNVEIERFTTPVTISGYNAAPSGDNILYNYKITAIDDIGETLPSNSLIIISGQLDLYNNPNTITWQAISGVSGYNIYGRTQNTFNYITTTTNSYFTDDGTETVDTSKTLPTTNTTISSYLYELPSKYIYLTIPVLSGINTGNVLYEGTDYSIEKLHYLRFPSYVANYTYSEYLDTREIFNAPQSLFLLPSLTNLYFKAFGELNSPENVIIENAYSPYISGWVTGDFSYFDERRLYAEHLKHLSQALTNALAKGPTFENLTDAFCLISGMPFSYEEGYVGSISNDGTYNYVPIISGNTYQIPEPMTLSVVEGNWIDKYDILASGIHLHDYISSSGIIEELTAEHPEQFWYTLGIQRSSRTYGLNYYPPFVEYFTDALLPAGILPNYFNLPPRGTIQSGSDFYNIGALATFSGIVTDPEGDILTYAWSHVAPLTSFDSSRNLACTMSTPTSISTTTTLTIPYVDRYYLFRLNVQDGDNSTNIDIEQNVYGSNHFTSWGQTPFILGDAELRYIYLT